MAFHPITGDTGPLAGASDVALNKVTNKEALTYDVASDKWTNRPTTAMASTDPTPGLVDFDTYFTGTTTNARIASMNEWAATHAGQPMPAVLFGAKQYTLTTPIKLFSGLKIIGGHMSPSREFDRGTTFKWNGGSESSLFVFPDDNNPRDISVSYCALEGGSTNHCLPNYDPSSASSAGRTLYNCQFHSCGFKNFKTVWWGWGEGSSISGETFVQSIIDTAFYLGGSGNRLFGADAYSMMASSAATLANKPMVRSIMSRSFIGNCMITARKSQAQLSIEGGSGLVVDQLAIDAQNSDPVYGAGIVIKGGDGIMITNCSFKGMAAQPADGWEGVANNRGWIHVSGGKNLVLSGNNFHRQGLTGKVPATSYPLLFAGPNVANNGIKWGFNAYSSFGSSSAVVQQSSSGKITALPDPRLNVETGA